MIITLMITIFVEGIVASGYSLWQRKPQIPILLTSVLANLFTQSLLWIALKVFFQKYLPTLFIAEALIWFVESFLLSTFPANKLRFKEAALLAFSMNLTSFALGWFLPV